MKLGRSMNRLLRTKLEPGCYSDAVVLALLEKHIVQYGSAKALAKAIGVSPAFLCDVRKGRRALSPAILTPLGFYAVTTYEVRM
jgi:hypothetical protein